MNYAKAIGNTIMHEAAIIRVRKQLVNDGKGNMLASINITPRLLKKVRPARARQLKRLMKYEARAK